MPIGTAKASRISREAVKSGCAREWGGWGQISEDGSGQHNPDRSEGPWGRAADPLARRCSSAHRSPTQSGGYPMAAESTKGDGKPACWEGPVQSSGLEAVLRKTHRPEF